MYRFTVIALAACAIAAAPVMASAEDFTVKVKTKDLNLQTEQGAKTAVDRIMREARKACTPEAMVGSRITQVDQACVDDIAAKLVRQVDAPLVKTAYDARKTSAGQG